MTVVWKHLTHPNVVPLLGVTIDPFQLVLESDIDMTGYVSNRTDTDRLNLVGALLPHVLYDTLTPSSVIRCGRRPQLPPLLQRYPWRYQGGMRSFLIVHRSRIDTQLVERPCGCRRSCANHGLRPRHCHSGPEFHTERSRRVWEHHSVDCTGDLGQPRDVQQGGGCLLICDAHD